LGIKCSLDKGSLVKLSSLLSFVLIIVSCRTTWGSNAHWIKGVVMIHLPIRSSAGLRLHQGKGVAQ